MHHLTLTYNIEDSALILEVISGKDERDSTSSSKKVDVYSNFLKKEKKKIAVLKDCLDHDGIDIEVKQKV